MPRQAEILILISDKMPDKPEVDQLANELSIDHDAVIGKLVRFWLWVKAQVRDGNANVTPSLLDRLTNCPGFTKALLKVGWLAERNSRLCVPRFDRYFGQPAINRALTKDRVERWRERHRAADPDDECNANVTPSKNGTSLSLDTTQEKASLRKKKTLEYPKAFVSFWEYYPLKTGKEVALKAWIKAGKRLRERGKTSAQAVEIMQKAVEAFAESDKGRGEFCPHAATWLNQGRYDDDQKAWQDRTSTKKPERMSVDLRQLDEDDP